MIDAALDLLAGGECVACGRPGRRLCGWCSTELPHGASPVRPTPCPDGLLPVVAAGDYDGCLRAVLLAHKERAALGLVVPLGRVLAEAVVVATPGPAVLVPVPSHPAVVRGRGHDPVLRVVRRAARVLRRRGTEASVRPVLGIRGRPLDQTGLTAGQREANLAGRFLVRGSARAAVARLGPGVVLVVDDVVTTGATLREAQRALSEAGCRAGAAVTLAATRRRLHLPDARRGD